MRNDADFAAYMAARWPFLVRSLVLIGCPRHEAEDVVQTGLARCYASWDRVRRADDVDAYVYRTVLNCWHKSRKRRWWGEVPTEVLPEAPTTEDPTDQVLLRQALEAQLARLSPEHREVLVLRFVADLTEPQVAEVLDVPVGTVKSRVSRALAQIDLAAVREVAG
ncbi:MULTISPECIES: SigE family RNA polymerase sigma factor [unclassified Nocardioides]|uniref:SigE family RNA polymerase sigma factor n=1 Tax=unclassified Nocardioides TaxID=2615069 RepID=UPI0009F06689|nr:MULTISPECIES: SigE family RNA polymerase sigma factor [unclassified Nocardioides]GAW49336.1 RNA polymerase sigma-E factor [Nocardioides sp. PD653-B2]GAW55150.1 RNA polymerase sigma-E factor [Nocardioides sp. PD653]